MTRIRLSIALALLSLALLARPAAADLPIIATAPFNQNKIDVSGGAFILGSGIENCTAAYTGAIRYNSATPRREFCDGASWQLLVKTQTSSIAAPAGSGYFVMSYGTWTGNLGGFAGADANCLTDLTTHTGWMGYATANANGQLVSTKVHAFLCVATTCNNLMPLTSYYFGDANNAGAGGASITTDSSGLGPGDSNNWSGASYFSGTYQWMSGRNSTSATQWVNSGPSYHCNGWTDGTTSFHVAYGNTASTNSTRWYNLGANACNVSRHLICYVDP